MPYRFLPEIPTAASLLKGGGLPDILDTEIISLVQETVGKITGLALAVMDADGREIVEAVNTSPLCRRRRHDKTVSSVCAASARYGADQAFALRGRFIYFCPCGLVRATIPVIVRGNYLGGFYIGQVWCDNAPESIPRLDHLLEKEGKGIPGDWQFRELRDVTPTYDFSYFSYITDMLAKVVDTVADRETARRVQLSALEAEKAGLEERVRQLERELHIRESALDHWKSRLNLEFMINGLNSVASLAVMDDAPRVNEMCVLFADHLRHYLARESDFSLLREEVDMVSGYLAMQKVRFGDALAYTIDVPEHAGKCRIPSRVLLPIVERAVLLGLAAREEGGLLTLSARLENDTMVVSVAVNVSMSEGEGLLQGALPTQSGLDTDGVAASFATARARLKILMGTRHDLRIVDTPDGSACILRYTLPHLEGLE